MTCILRCLQKVCEDDEMTELTMAIAEIIAGWEDIARFNALVTGMNFEANLTLEGLLAEPLTGRCLLFYDYVESAAGTFMAVVARPITEVTGNELQWRIRAGAPLVREGLIRRGPAESSLTDLHNRYALALQLSGPETLTVFGGDFRAMWHFWVA